MIIEYENTVDERHTEPENISADVLFVRCLHWPAPPDLASDVIQ